MAEIQTETITVGGNEVFVRRTAGDGTPTVFVHGNPTHSADWEPFLRNLEGPAVAADVIGFGRSAKPRRHDYSMHGLARDHELMLDELGVGDHNLVVHDWGGLALIAAQRRPRSIRRLVVINAVPLLAGYRWHWIARLWRRRLVGELANATTTRRSMALLMRQARYRYRAMPGEFLEMIAEGWDRGTRRAVLRLYRSADPEALAEAGAGLESLSCPALVVWGTSDPYLPERFGAEYARRLDAELDLVDRAGHWPWIDRPEVVDRVTGFLAADRK